MSPRVVPELGSSTWIQRKIGWWNHSAVPVVQTLQQLLQNGWIPTHISKVNNESPKQHWTTHFSAKLSNSQGSSLTLNKQGRFNKLQDVFCPWTLFLHLTLASSLNVFILSAWTTNPILAKADATALLETRLGSYK